MADFLDAFILDLLHLDDGRKNKLLDLGDSSDNIRRGAGENAFFLSLEGKNSGIAMIETVRRRIGKLSNNTVLAGSSLDPGAFVNASAEKWNWHDLSGGHEPATLHAFINEVYGAITATGNNPLFMGVGALKWRMEMGDKLETVVSPLLIFPIRLVRGARTSPIEIEFVDDEAYFNPCLINKLRLAADSVASAFPHPNGDGADFGDPISLEKLGDGRAYFSAVADFVANSVFRTAPESVFEFLPDTVAIARYEHSDLCMYYDVRRNKDRIYAHPLISAIFGLGKASYTAPANETSPDLVLPSDSVQKKLIRRVCNGESLIVKGPPGTGKTLTIANMIAALLAQGKSVLLSSKKLSALCEVSAKLPERLRKFIMLMEAESERNAVALDPATVRSDLKNVLRLRREYRPDPSLASSLEVARGKHERVCTELDRYYRTMFRFVVAGRVYYDALDAYMAGEGLPEIDFIRPKDAAAVSASEYGTLLESIKLIGSHAAVMRGGAETLSRCAWFGVGTQTDGDVPAILSEAEHIAKCIDEVQKLLALSEERHPSIPYGSLTLSELLTLAGNETFHADELIALFGVASSAVSDEELNESLAEFERNVCADESAVNFTRDVTDPVYIPLATLSADGEIPLSEAEGLAAACGILLGKGAAVRDEVTVGKVLEIAERATETEKEAHRAELEAKYIFDRESEDGRQVLLKACELLKDYGGEEKPRTFDFGARRIVKKLRALCSDEAIGFQALLGGVKAYGRYDDAMRTVAADRRFIKNCLGAETDEETIRKLGFVAVRCRELGIAPAVYAGRLNHDLPALMQCAAAVAVSPDFTVGRLARAYVSAAGRNRLTLAVNKCCAEAGVGPRADIVTAARSLLSVRKIARSDMLASVPADGRDEFIAGLFDLDERLRAALGTLIAACAEFGNKRFSNYWFPAPHERTADELMLCRAQLLDRRTSGAALDYYAEAERVIPAVDIKAFLRPIEEGEIDADQAGFAALFEHSFFASALRYACSALGGDRAGMGAEAARALERYAEVCRESEELNARRIENFCLARISADDDDFDFLNVDSGAGMNVRGLFRNYAPALMKLKKCFIVSPSTISAMFRANEYFDFDVAILDEASQIEPVCLLPVLVRAKQCVLVGDEFQMPPIRHFKLKRYDTIMDYEKELEIDHDISALSLALENLAFDTEELACHYRSLTESLIAFSQREFYPHMRTFPAAVPYSRDIGFSDIFIEEGRCAGGVNLAEAEKVVEVLREHFARHYTSDGGLKMSVGVVAFGEAQIEKICGLVKRDRDLYDKIQTAREKCDVPEKAVFFKTIETVQGSEIDHLILSLTYGRDAEGRVQNRFGELNRDGLGRCIFNVAVTRAKSKVTLIHSVRSAALNASSARIKFIVDYLRMAEVFARGGKEQFVSSPPERGAHFIASVADFVASCGISRDRIVINYGVTGGSIRVPIAILDQSLSTAVLGLWCELPPDGKYSYLDGNVGYFNSLKARGWQMYRVSAHDWYDNAVAEREDLRRKIAEIK